LDLSLQNCELNKALFFIKYSAPDIRYSNRKQRLILGKREPRCLHLNTDLYSGLKTFQSSGLRTASGVPLGSKPTHNTEQEEEAEEASKLFL
jgi:hypothetical protein